VLLTLAEAQARYGAIVNGVWADETKWCVPYSIPEGITLLNCAGTVQKHIYCNRDMLVSLAQVFQNVIHRVLADELKTFDGCYEIRDVRGEPGKVSTHSYALALDFNAATNKLGCQPAMSPALVACFTDVGFKWGGEFARQDGMHFQFADW
jgi:hypothetical protein